MLCHSLGKKHNICPDINVPYLLFQGWLFFSRRCCQFRESDMVFVFGGKDIYSERSLKRISWGILKVTTKPCFMTLNLCKDASKD